MEQRLTAKTARATASCEKKGKAKLEMMEKLELAWRKNERQGRCIMMAKILAEKNKNKNVNRM